jgi:hypothetical protein
LGSENLTLFRNRPMRVPSPASRSVPEISTRSGKDDIVNLDGDNVSPHIFDYTHSLVTRDEGKGKSSPFELPVHDPLIGSSTHTGYQRADEDIIVAYWWY